MATTRRGFVEGFGRECMIYIEIVIGFCLTFSFIVDCTNNTRKRLDRIETKFNELQKQKDEG
jgi:hypothetical protein